MDRKRAIVTGITTAAAVAVAAVAIPAVAEEDPTGPATTPQAAGDWAPELVSALQRNLSISADQARERLRVEAWASRTTRQLSTELGDDYAGTWLSDDGTELMVAVTDRAEAARVKAAGAQPRVVTHSATELAAAIGRLDRNADAASPDITGWQIDVSANQVVILAKPGAEVNARRFAARSGLPAGAVKVRTSEANPVPLADIIGGEPYLIAEQSLCSVGFAVEGGFVTAGHCGKVGAPTNEIVISTGLDGAPASAIGDVQGIVVVSSFPGNDFGVVETNGDFVPQPFVRDFNGGLVPVAGSQEAPVGASVCRSGITTGTFCGTIQALNATVTYPEGVVTGLTQTDVCAEPGDSGGSWISGDQAQGVTSGGSGNCTEGGVTFFQPLTEILERNNLTLVTTSNASDPPPEGADTPPVGDEAACDGQVVREGEVREGGGTAEPSGRSFRAPAGTHTACLVGPDGAELNLDLQQFSAGAFRTVAQATAAGADEELTHNGPAGVYRYVVRSEGGSGSYTLAFSVD